MDATTAPTATSATSSTKSRKTCPPSSPSFYVTTAWRMGRTGASLEPGTAGVAVPAMARLAPASLSPSETEASTTVTFEGLMMEAHREPREHA